MTLDLDVLLAEATALIENAEPELVPVVLAKRQLGVRFLPMSGADWRDLVLRHPARPDVQQDLNLGYNVDAVVAAYPDVVVIDGDELDDMLRTDAEGKQFSKWPAVWGKLTATSRKDVAAAMWAAHELTPDQLVVEAGKVSAASRKKKPS